MSDSNTSEQSDSLLRFLLDDSDIRGEIVTLSKSFQESCLHQDLGKNEIPLYGEFLASSALLSALFKRDGLLTLQAQGDGSLRAIAAEANSEGHVRGIVRKNTDTLNTDKSLSFLDGIGKGNLFLTLDPTEGQRYQGIVPMEHDSLGACLTDYFDKSEQIPTIVILFANHNQCGGLLLQCLPAHNEKDEEVRARKWQEVEQLCATVKEKEFFETDQTTMLYRLFHDQSCRVFEPKNIDFKCSCSRERSAHSISALGYEDAQLLIEEQRRINIHCEFCGVEYQFNRRDLEGIFDKDQTSH
ncbi:MAG: molecular chaperone Hsp33 [Flavobacteriales bacterium]|jgi:molecular chaperone Hsp33